MPKALELFISEAILGYLVQCVACILCVQAIAKKRITFFKGVVSSVVFAVLVYLLRKYVAENLNFGVHTILSMIILSAICVLYLKADIPPVILGAILSTVMILGGELVDIGYIIVVKGIAADAVSGYMQSISPVTKAWLALPGNILMLAITAVMYWLRAVRKGNKNGEAGKKAV